VLQLAAASGIGSFIGGGARAEAAALSAIGVQLYTVRDQVTEGRRATIKAVRGDWLQGSRGPAGHAAHGRARWQAERPHRRQHAPRRPFMAGPTSIPSGNADLTATIESAKPPASSTS
jgi:hypothetical protein